MKHANDNAVDEPIRFLSVCSGIEAASVAWGPLGWEAVAFSEIEKFPSAVLAHHYPDVPNLGDFTRIDTTQLGRVDVLCGGTPCQAFSVAGLRQSLDDARGNLSLEFVRLAHELADGNGLRNVVWENVVGVLSTKDNAFGCFLAGLVGAASAIEPPARGKWGSAGLVAGPKGRAAWRIVDAQYFGVAQRRRRVIVVADFGNGADPAQVLFELDGVQRHSAPSRETGQGFAADVAPSLTASGRGVERTGDTRGQDPVVAVSYTPEIARCDATREGSSQDYETTTMVVAPFDQFNASLGEHVSHTMEKGDGHARVPSGVYSIMPQNSGKDYKARVVDVAQPIMAAGTSIGNQGGDVVCVTGEIAHTLKAEGADASEDGTGRGTPIIAFDCKASGQSGFGIGEIAGTQRAMGHANSHTNGGGHQAAMIGSAVRRLTPTECERLQGFPDGYTDIPWRRKPSSPDGPRYKALGNSWAVPKFVWLGRRISMLMPQMQEAKRAA